MWVYYCGWYGVCIMLSNKAGQKRRQELMDKHKKKRGGFYFTTESQLCTMYRTYRVDSALEMYLFRPNKGR